MVLTTIQHLAVIVLAAYLLARLGFFTRAVEREPLTAREQLAGILLFAVMALYCCVWGVQAGGIEVSTAIISAALAALLLGLVPGLCVAAVTAASLALLQPVTLAADVAAVLLATVFFGWYRNYMKELDSVLAGILVGMIEIVHMLLIVALVKPMPLAKEIVYEIGFSMIILNGCAVILFLMLLNDIRSRQQMMAKQAYMNSELNIAAQIQMSLLENDFALDSRLDFHALLIPAQEVGGDLYSFVNKADGCFCFILGDVSGKGIPAAIIMSRTVALFQTSARVSSEPEVILAEINEALAHNNDTSMFVTAVVGKMDLNSGEFTYSNAGHTPPFLVSGHSPALDMPKPRGMALGMLPGRKYKTETRKILPGEYALFYTDGVSEAETRSLEQFGEDRIREVFAAGAPGSAEEVNRALLEAVKGFVGEAVQSDDIAVCALGHKGISVPPKGEVERA
ncbi:MAG: SpoIIE family protein phosphatase [Syntrophomonadaceae bacterium]|nr:SpoIIE family protein phosphatase [Syntrophomonadaceae bacterium]